MLEVSNFTTILLALHFLIYAFGIISFMLSCRNCFTNRTFFSKLHWFRTVFQVHLFCNYCLVRLDFPIQQSCVVFDEFHIQLFSHVWIFYLAVIARFLRTHLPLIYSFIFSERNFSVADSSAQCSSHVQFCSSNFCFQKLSHSFELLPIWKKIFKAHKSPKGHRTSRVSEKAQKVWKFKNWDSFVQHTSLLSTLVGVNINLISLT